jgi:hypothetical protein
MMSRVQKGMVAGFFATVAVSILEAVNVVAGPWTQPFPSVVATLIGMEGNLVVGWIAHFLVGTVVLGALFGVLCPRLPTQTPETKGIVFAVIAWVVMMAGAVMFGDPRMFNQGGGFAVVAWMLATHIVFGIVLGNVYARLVEREKRAHHGDMSGAAPAH